MEYKLFWNKTRFRSFVRIQFFHYELVSNQHLTVVGLLAQLVEHYTAIAEVTGSIRTVFFLFRLNFHHCFKIVFNCDDHLHLLICSSNSWHSYVNSSLVYHLDNQNFTLLFSCTFFLQPDEKSSRLLLSSTI